MFLPMYGCSFCRQAEVISCPRTQNFAPAGILGSPQHEAHVLLSAVSPEAAVQINTLHKLDSVSLPCLASYLPTGFLGQPQGRYIFFVPFLVIEQFGCPCVSVSLETTGLTAAQQH